MVNSPDAGRRGRQLRLAQGDAMSRTTTLLRLRFSPPMKKQRSGKMPIGGCKDVEGAEEVLRLLFQHYSPRPLIQTHHCCEYIGSKLIKSNEVNIKTLVRHITSHRCCASLLPVIRHLQQFFGLGRRVKPLIDQCWS